MPSIFFAASSASSAFLTTLTPPPLPRPPAWICALTTTTPPPSRVAASRALRGVEDHLALRHGHAVPRKDGLSLILVNFHDVGSRFLLESATCQFCLTRPSDASKRHRSASPSGRKVQSERLAPSESRALMPSRFRRVFSSSVGTKLLMGLTGAALFVYMLLHLAGNALIFAGPEVFNEYSAQADLEPADHPDRDRPARDLPDPHLQGGDDVDG